MDETKNVTFNAFDRDAEIESSERNLLHWFQADAARRPKVTNHFEQQKGATKGDGALRPLIAGRAMDSMLAGLRWILFVNRLD